MAIPRRISVGQWRPIATLETPTRSVKTKNHLPNPRSSCQIKSASGTKKAICPEGKEPLAE